MSYSIHEVAENFGLKVREKPFGNGHINDTYISEGEPKYILQRINHNVFKNPADVMENISKVCNFLRNKIVAAGGDGDRETLNFITARDGKYYYKTEDGNYFRAYKFVGDCYAIDIPKNTEEVYNAALAFGKFQKLLANFPASELHETIKDFHNTPKRFEALEDAIKNDACSRLKDIAPEVEFAMAHKDICSLIVDGIADGSIPLRVTHNDTKINNVLIDDKTGKGLCVIDLDTVMPGSMLYDFGDALRAGTNTAAEDEVNLELVTCDINMFEAFARGFCDELSDSLTKREIELLGMSGVIMTFECGIRFLTDYLNGDTYFKIHREGHNLDRARNQFKLVSDMESKLDDMANIVKKILSK